MQDVLRAAGSEAPYSYEGPRRCEGHRQYCEQGRKYVYTSGYSIAVRDGYKVLVIAIPSR